MQKILNIDKKYESFRWFFTSNNILVVGGKNDEQNELALDKFLKPEYYVLHTTAPGSPFCIIKSDNPGKKDIDEAAIFCACFSQQWKLGTKEINVDVFKGNQIYKSKGMKTGTFGVEGKRKTIKVKPELVLIVQNNKLRAVPKASKQQVIAEIKQGKLSKEETVEKIFKILKEKLRFVFSKDEIMSAIPSDKLSVR